MRSFFVAACILSCSFSYAQYTVCEVRQFLNGDSLNQTLAKTEKYNSRGQLISETYSDYKTDASTTKGNGTYLYTYNDTLLLQWVAGYENGDSSRMKFEYNALGQLSRQHYFFREATPAERHSPNEHAVYAGEPSRDAGKWLQTSLVNYSYDNKGRKTRYDASRLHYSMENIFTWEYDEQGRISKACGYAGPRLLWQEDYTYNKEGYKYWRVWYDAEGNMKHEAEVGTPGYMPMYIYTIKYDQKGRESSRIVTDEKLRSRSQTKTFYDAEGRIARTEFYGADTHLAITHIFSYK